MNAPAITKYFPNCFVLALPILAWNIMLANSLPPAYLPGIFDQNIPVFITFGENISRMLLFVLMLFMPLRPSTKRQHAGLTVYTAGTLLYFASWLTLIYFPDSSWSQSAAGFMAPAYTPFIWLMGIAMAGNTTSPRITRLNRAFVFVSIVFLIMHIWHTYIVYAATHL